MKSTKELIKEIKLLEIKIKSRAKEVLQVTVTDYPVYIDSICYTLENDIEINFIEDTRHDCPDRFHIILKASDIDMDDNEWKIHIEKLTQETINKKQRAIELEKERQLKLKEEQFEKLKKELGK